MKEAKEFGSSDEASSAQKVYDIGDVIDGKSKNVTDNEKYVMFKNHFRPGEKYEVKKTLNAVVTGLVKESTYQNASFIALKMMVPTASPAVCFWLQIGKDHSVRLLTTDTANDTISKKNNFVMPVTAITNRQSSRLEKFENPTNTVKTVMDENLKQRYQVYPKVAEALARVVHLLGKQGRALRGHQQSSDASHNQDSFLTLVHAIAH